MGISATDVMMKYPKWHKFNDESCNMISRDIIEIEEFKDTLNVIKEKKSKIIIAGSGMLSGGRVLEYLKAYVEDKKTTVLFVGYQAEGDARQGDASRSENILRYRANIIK